MSRRPERRVLIRGTECELVEVRLADEHRACLTEARHDRRVSRRHVPLTHT